MNFDLDARPVLIAIAGPNGAGKSTFYQAHLSYTGLPFVNADVIAHEASLGAYEAAAIAEELRYKRLENRESFVFETVFSDPAGHKLVFLELAAAKGYMVVVFFLGIANAAISSERVAMRVLEGGHGVPQEKLTSRFPRVMENLRMAMLRLPMVRIYDNSDLRRPFRFCLATSEGKIVEHGALLPAWLKPLLPR